MAGLSALLRKCFSRALRIAAKNAVTGKWALSPDIGSLLAPMVHIGFFPKRTPGLGTTNLGPSSTLPSAETNWISKTNGSLAGIIRVSSRSNRFERVLLPISQFLCSAGRDLASVQRRARALRRTSAQVGCLPFA
jgi:hypothetical protein